MLFGAMSRFMAAIYDWFMADMEEACGRAWRADLLSELRGDVLEVGAGTGRNLEHYADLGRLVLAEPDPHMRKKLALRTSHAAVSRTLDVVPWSAERLDCPDGSFDAVVSTLVLCSVREPARALAEMRRVLREGGRLVFLEHVAASDPRRLAWQHRLQPVWGPLAGNCHLCRDTERAITDAGFHVDRIVRESARKALPIVRPTIRGVALR